jgi:hypothetical protein
MFMPEKSTLQPYRKINYDNNGVAHPYSWDTYLWWDQDSLETYKDAIDKSRRLFATVKKWAESNSDVNAFKREYDKVKDIEPMHYIGDEIEKSVLLQNVMYAKIHTLVHKNGLPKDVFDFVFTQLEREFIRMIGSFLVYVYTTRM